MTREERHKAIVRRRVFVSFCVIVLAAVAALIIYAARAVFTPDGEDKNGSDSGISSMSSQSSDDQQDSSADNSSESEPDTPSYPDEGPNGLDANYSKLLLVNGEHPLAEDYDYQANLMTIPNEYLNNSWFKQIGGQIDKDVWPYMKAMIDAAWADGVDLYVWSPYRSYDTQKTLFENQVNSCKANAPSLTQAEAEAKAATVVARPGTSEHHTGLAADFNMASDSFENTEMYKWMQENAEDYGFVMRYSAEKQPITGVIHESWHYRFVGINNAKEMNRLGMCLEEYLEYLGENS